MAKRFFDSFKFDDPWYRQLTPIQKCFWEFLLCKCDHAGIWKPDMELANFCIGGKLSDLKFLEGRISVLSDGDWFIPKFIKFQYGTLNPEVKAHKSVISRLNEKSIDTTNSCQTVSEQLANSCLTVKDKNKDKDKEKEKLEEKNNTINISSNTKFNKDKDNQLIKKSNNNINNKGGYVCDNPPSVDEVVKYCLERNNGIDGRYFYDKLSSVGWIEKNGHKLKDWKATIRTWERFSKKEKDPYEGMQRL